tara:strand:+ start:393 stop:602 length:210 start_codon:yes stop_codon:yes gene_type:complete
MVLAFYSWHQEKQKIWNKRREEKSRENLAEAFKHVEYRDPSIPELEIVNPEYVDLTKRKCPADLLNIKL